MIKRSPDADSAPVPRVTGGDRRVRCGVFWGVVLGVLSSSAGTKSVAAPGASIGAVPRAETAAGTGAEPRTEARAEWGTGAGVEVRADARSEIRARAFAAVELAVAEQAALIASGGESVVRWPVPEVRAVAGRWNAAVLEASRAPVISPLLREQWSRVVGGAAEAWSNLALDADRPADADGQATLAVDAHALGDDAAAILPVVQAVCEGSRAALLLTTSVGCECTMQRAALMEEVWAALTTKKSGTAEPAVGERPHAAARPRGSHGGPGPDLRPFLGRSDLASSPDLPDALGLDRVPGWLLLEPGGGIVFRIDGGEGVAEITTMIRRWLGGEDFHL